MKKNRRVWTIACVVLLVCASLAPVYGDTYATGSAVVPISGGGIQVNIQGTVTPTILSVTLPSDIAFEIGKSNGGDNKVLSPDIHIINGSDQGVYIYAKETQVDVNNLGGTQYVPSTSGGSIMVATGGAIEVSGSGILLTQGAIQVQPNEIAIGLSEEWVPTGGAVMPGLSQARWLIQDPFNQEWMSSTQVAYVSGNGTATLHVVGVIGRDVPEDRTFSVRPTIIASYSPMWWSW